MILRYTLRRIPALETRYLHVEFRDAIWIVAIIVLAGALLLLCILCCRRLVWPFVLTGPGGLSGYALQPTVTITRQVALATATPARPKLRHRDPGSSNRRRRPTRQLRLSCLQPCRRRLVDIEPALLTNPYERVNPSVVNIIVLAAGEQVAPGMGIPTPENPDEL
ncbi:hypothetical protein, partial [Candidatus Amarobacter glycogenicus]|uniref:hypothetical protein n=1 Tax=Candidatus Amarobacter glycogenicus TaxID=3140699 RepID=UPI0031CC5136